MSKTLVGIIEVVAGVALIVTGAGAGYGALLIGAGVTTLLSKVPKPPQTYQSIKTERPARFSAYAVNRLAPVTIPYR